MAKKWTKEEREAESIKQKALAAERKGQVVKVASIPDAIAQKDAEIERLRAELEVANSKRSDAEAAALKMAEAQTLLLQPTIHEIPTTKLQRVQKCTGYKSVGYKDDGRPILRPIFKNVDVPTYFYRIDMPPVGGEALRINGVPFYHGMTGEFDMDTLRTVKDMVYRLWKHDSDIHGSDENFYRKQNPGVISMRQA